MLFEIGSGVVLLLIICIAVARKFYPRLLYFPEHKVSVDFSPAVDNIQFENASIQCKVGFCYTV